MADGFGSFGGVKSTELHKWARLCSVFAVNLNRSATILAGGPEAAKRAAPSMHWAAGLATAIAATMLSDEAAAIEEDSRNAG